MKKSILQNCIFAFATLAMLIAVWVIAYFGAGNGLLVPSPWECVEKIGGLFMDGAFWSGVLRTLGRVFIAFAFSFVLAVVFAVIAYTVPVFGRVLSPIVSVLRSLPVLAVTLILLVAMGARNAPMAVAFLSLFPMLYAGISAALAQVDPELVEMSRVYKAPLWTRILRLYLPSASPYVLRESGAAASFSLKLVVSAEVLANTYRSLGGMMQEAKIVLDMPLLFALVCVAAVIGLLLEGAAALIAGAVERRVQ